MNRTLEAMSSALFKSWFVDFEPVRAKQAGRDPGLPVEIADLFPERLTDSPFGPTPDGWGHGVLGDIAENPKRSIKPEEMEDGSAYIGLEHMPRKSIALADWGNASSVTSAKNSFHKGEILFGKLRPYFHKVGVAVVGGVCSTDILVISPREDHWFGMTLGYLSSEELVAYADSAATGTRMPRTNWKRVSSYPVVIPSRALIERFDEYARTTVGRIEANIFENRSLTSLRDILLPKLISGQLPIPAAEPVAERATA